MDEYTEKVIQNEVLLKSLDEKITMKIENIMSEIQRTNNKIDKLDKKIDSVSSDVKELQEKLPDIVDERVDERIRNNKVNKVYSVFRWIVTSVVGTVAVSVLVKLLTSRIGV